MDDAAQNLADISRAPTQDGPNVRLYLVDGSGFIFRAYHALPPLTRKSDGLPVGAVQGFCNMLWKLMVDMKAAPDAPTHLAVVFDHSEKTFRNDLYAQYKAHRPPAPEDLVPQFPLVREATRAFGAPCLELAGYEADDLIAAYCCAVRDAGGEVVIVSSDKDLMQLIGERVSMLDTMKNVRIGRDQVIEKFGVGPERVVDVQALCGDSVDNVPGAPGIGVKTASALINEYGDLETLLARAGEIKQEKRRADPDRLRRPDPPVARAGEARLRHAAAGADRRSGGARARAGDAGRISRTHGVPHPGAACLRRGRDRRAGEDAGAPRGTGRQTEDADRHLGLCLRARSRDAGGVDRPGLRGRDGGVRHRDRRPLLGQRRSLRRVAGGGAGRGLLHPGRPLRGGRVVAGGGGRSEADPH